MFCPRCCTVTLGDPIRCSVCGFVFRIDHPEQQVPIWTPPDPGVYEHVDADGRVMPGGKASAGPRPGSSEWYADQWRRSFEEQFKANTDPIVGSYYSRVVEEQLRRAAADAQRAARDEFERQRKQEGTRSEFCFEWEFVRFDGIHKARTVPRSTGTVGQNEFRLLVTAISKRLGARWLTTMDEQTLIMGAYAGLGNMVRDVSGSDLWLAGYKAGAIVASHLQCVACCQPIVMIEGQSEWHFDGRWWRHRCGEGNVGHEAVMAQQVAE
jgi:hypothetical protein